MKTDSIFALREEVGKPFFTPTSLGISPRKVDKWKNSGLIEDPNPNKRLKYSIRDAVWLKLIEILRVYGVHYKNILFIKDQLSQDFDYYKHIDPQNLIGKQVHFDMTKSNKKITFNLPSQDDRSKQEVTETHSRKITMDEESASGIAWLALRGDYFQGILADSLINRVPSSLHITEDFKVTYLNREIISQNDFNIEEKLNETYLSINLSKIIAEILPGENNKCQSLYFLVLNKDEKEVFNQIRKNDVVQITVKKDKGNDIQLIEASHPVNSVTLETKLTELILKNGYQRIEIQAQNGSISHITNTIKIKP